MSLANNHILDAHPDPGPTSAFLEDAGISAVGAGSDRSDAASPVEVRIDGRRYVFLVFGWAVIGCPSAREGRPDVNPLRREHVLRLIRENREDDPEAAIVVHVHWIYELGAFPQPRHRALARTAVEAGASLVVGCHSHRVEGIEVHDGAPIVFGLGNWFFPQGVYAKGTLTYPEVARTQMAFEWRPAGDSLCHWFRYDPETHGVEYVASEPLSASERVRDLTPYAGMDDASYSDWLRTHRTRRKLLPAFDQDDGTLVLLLKEIRVMLRGWGIALLLSWGWKPHERIG